MIKPSDCQPRTTTETYEQDLATLEHLCDTAIRKADASRSWPALVRTTRRFPSRAIEQAARSYRAAGWAVETPPIYWGRGEITLFVIEFSNAT